MISIVVPVYNEEESLYKFYSQLIIALKPFRKRYEVLFVDDGSTDDSLALLKQIEKKDKNIILFSLRKNEGKAEALTCAFTHAKGEYIITLDADLQDMPSEMENLLQKAKEGWDLVCGWRKNRQDSFFKILSSKLFNFLTRVLWGLKLHDYNCGLKVYTREAAKSLTLYGGMHRFIPLLLHQQGFKVSETEVNHQKRAFGKSKYGFSKLWKDFPDIFTLFFLTKFKDRPFHFFGTIGIIFIIVGVIILSYLTLLRLEGQIIGRRPLLFFGMLLVISGLQVFFTGFLADLIISISYKNKKEFGLKYSSEDLP